MGLFAWAQSCAAFWLSFPTSCLHRHVGTPTGWYPTIVFLHAGFSVVLSKGKIIKADAPTIQLDATPSRLIGAPPPSSPPFCHNPPNLSWLGIGTKYAGLHTQQFGLHSKGYIIPGFIQKQIPFFTTFQNLQTKFQGLPRLTKLIFKDFPGYIWFTNMAAWGPKSAHTKSVISVAA